MKSTALAASSVVALLLATSVPTRSQQEAPFSHFLGAYESDSVEADRHTIEDAILRGTEPMGPLRRSVARRRLRNVNVPVRRLRILVEGEHLVTEFDGDRYVSHLDGRPQRGRDPDGKVVTVFYREAGNVLHARYVGEDGEKRIDFVRSGGDRLTLSVSLISDQLPATIRYRLPYHAR